MRHLATLAACVALVAACGDGSPGGNNNNNNNGTCAQGLERQGPACVPIFDDCAGPSEIPVLGGGCRTVGVTQCATGFVPDGEAGCDPVLPAAPCPAGTMEVLGETECQPVGVTQCATGFVSDGEGGCDAILPAAPCPDGTLEVLGHTDCQSIGDCGTSTWGNITTDATTVFVDATADATGADGSDASPFTTIDEALAVVEPGGQIAVAAGQYTERLVIGRPVHLAGRCAELVRVHGTNSGGEDLPPVYIGAGGSGTMVQGLTLTGDASGLSIDGAQSVRVEEVQVLGTGSNGVELNNGAAASLTRVVVADCTLRGIKSIGSVLTVYESVVRDTQEDSSGRYGRGISAGCDPIGGVCGSLRVERCVVARNTQYGIGTLGVDTEVVATVVRDTRPNTDGKFGRGIHAQCFLSGACGSLSVDGSVVAGNRDLGVAVLGVPTDITSTVVRDTEVQQLNQTFGHGIAIQCYSPTAACGTATVTDSVVVANREAGISTMGTDVTITSTVIQDTSARSSDLQSGHGVLAACNAQLNACGRLTIARSLVERNRGAGVNILGPEATIRSTVIRDTLARESDATLGRGISAQCSPGGVCGSLTVSSSVVSGNRDVGVFAAGVDASVTGTLIRDTAPQQSDGESGKGIGAQCFTDTGACTTLTVTGSVVTANRDIGIFLQGADADITSTVVRDTSYRESDGYLGRGINAQCDSETGTCGTLTVENSLVRGNQELGFYLAGVDASVVFTVIRDTAAREVDGTFGRGIESNCDYDVSACGSLAVDGCLITGNTDVGISSFGVDVAVAGTVVRDTRAQPADFKGGRGINAQCSPAMDACGSLTVTGSRVHSNRNTGIFVVGVPTVLWGTAVEETRPNDQGEWRDDYGQGIFALCQRTTGDCNTLQVTNCTVLSATTAGLAVQGIDGFIESSLISTVPARPLDDAFGYGIQIAGLETAGPSVFHVRSCQILDSDLAGVLYNHASGTVSGSRIRGGLYTVVAAVGSTPEVTDDNDLSGTERDGIFWANMEPCPAPSPALPAGL